MKKIFAAIFICISIFSMSCQKSLSVIDHSNDEGAGLGDGDLLVRSVSLWGDGTTMPADSAVTEYTYNSAGNLIQQQTAGYTYIGYTRDVLERITRIAIKQNSGDTVYSDVHYTGGSSTQVAYILYGTNAGAAEPDSLAFTYAGGHVATTSFYTRSSGSAALVYYQNWSYDGSGNVTQLEVYQADSTLNIGYDFEYDNKINPRYAADDARLPVEWGYTVSPNNIAKQTNHYGNPPVMPSDYVTYTYDYNVAGRPTTGLHAGPAIGSQTEQMRFYYE